jgi:uncharacterized RDD family membrane protein YckC
MAFCSKCGKEFPDGNQFCSSCGEAVAGGAPAAASGASTATPPPPPPPAMPKAPEWNDAAAPSSGGSGGSTLAPYSKRLGGYVLDAIILGVASLIVIVIFSLLKVALIGFLLAFLFFLFYAPYFIGSRGGQTIGMKATGVKCVDAKTGETASFGKGFGRNILHLVFGFFYILQILDLLWPLWDDKNQTIHDKAASTVVVLND